MLRARRNIPFRCIYTPAIRQSASPGGGFLWPILLQSSPFFDAPPPKKRHAFKSRQVYSGAWYEHSYTSYVHSSPKLPVVAAARNRPDRAKWKKSIHDRPSLVRLGLASKTNGGNILETLKPYVHTTVTLYSLTPTAPRNFLGY